MTSHGSNGFTHANRSMWPITIPVGSNGLFEQAPPPNHSYAQKYWGATKLLRDSRSSLEEPWPSTDAALYAPPPHFTPSQNLPPRASDPNDPHLTRRPLYPPSQYPIPSQHSTSSPRPILIPMNCSMQRTSFLSLKPFTEEQKSITPSPQSPFRPLP